MTPRQRLADARLYLCAPTRDRAFYDAAMAGGVDLMQLRDKPGDVPLEAAAELAASEVMRDAVREAGGLFSTNDRADLALLLGSDVLHVGQGDLTPVQVRRLLGDGPVLGVSTHTPGEVDAAMADDRVDYVCVGPVWPTPTKPGRPGAGLALVEHAASVSSKPWFAIGGIDATNVRRVVDAGATRVVVVRAVTAAADPRAAAAELVELLRG